MNQQRPTELLAPAGTEKSLGYALAYGADAVYAGIPSFSLRARNNPFTIDKLAHAIETTHQQNKKLYVTANIYPHNAKITPFLSALEELIPLRPDALIMADPGLILLARERWPEMPIHLSVQANTLNHAAVRFWQQNGVERIILSRELSLDEIEEIRQTCPDMELEVFIHGALCISYSGRCLLSGYFTQRDANQGSCANSCRWNYKLYTDDPTVAPADAPRYWLEESERPGHFMPISEDEHGTYILNSRDLCAIEHVARLVKMGINSLKIEGRTKSHFYVARVTQIYRQAIDAALRGEPVEESLRDGLMSLAHRGYTDGFLGNANSADRQNYDSSHSIPGTHRFVGELLQRDGDWIEVEVKNKFTVGDRMLMITPSGDLSFSIDELLDSNRQPVQVAPGSGHRVWLRSPTANMDRWALLLRAEPSAGK